MNRMWLRLSVLLVLLAGLQGILGQAARAAACQPSIASASLPQPTVNGACARMRTVFSPVISKSAVLVAGSLGLPGEPVVWVITVENQGTAPGTDLIITDTVRDEMRVDTVGSDRGAFAVNGQMVTFTIPRLDPGEWVQMRINTTLLQGPADGYLTNDVWLSGVGPDGTVKGSASAQLPVPTSLPATGYPPEDLPGEGEPPLWAFGLGAAALVALTSWLVWRRGSRSLRRA